MSDTVKGTLEEIAIVKKGRSAKGPWALRKITVDGEKYSTFENIKAAIGSIVEFESEENDNGFLDIVKGTFEVIKEATAKESAQVKATVSAASAGKEASIENQVALKSAVKFATAFELDPDDTLGLVAKAYKQFASHLHPQQAAVATPAKKKPKPAEEESQDPNDQEQETPDY